MNKKNGPHHKTLETLRMLAEFSGSHVLLKTGAENSFDVLQASPEKTSNNSNSVTYEMLEALPDARITNTGWNEIEDNRLIKPFVYGCFFDFQKTDIPQDCRLLLFKKDRQPYTSSQLLLIEQTRNAIEEQLGKTQNSPLNQDSLEKLEDSKKRLQILINATPDIICFKDAKGRWMEANEAIQQLFRLQGKDIRFKDDEHLKKLVPELSEAFDQCRKYDQEAWNKKKPITKEEIIPRPNGDERILDVIRTPVFDSNGNRQGLVLLGRDITARKKAEELLRESEQRFRNVALHANDIIFEWNPYSDRINWFGKAEYLTRKGAPPASLKGFARLLHPEDRHRFVDCWRNQLKNQMEWKDEFRLNPEFEEVNHFRGNGVMLFKSNKPYKLVGTLTNVTQEKRLIKNLKEAVDESQQNQARITGLLSVIPDMLFVFNKKGDFIDYHVKEDHSLLLAPENFLDRNADEVLPPEIASLTHKKIEATQLHKKVETYEYQLNIDNQIRTFESRMVYVDDDRYLTIVRDVTRARKAEQDLREAKEQAEKSDHLKSAFLANMSHEIRTPLNGILGFSELLKNESIDEVERQNCLDIIIKSGNQLLSIINDVLEISRLETGQITLIRDRVNLTRLITDLGRFFEIEAKEKSVKLKEQKPENDFFAYLDGGKVTQIFNNLLNNAFKFTSPGGNILFGFEPRQDHLLCFVHDDGIGIAPRHHNLIFERFGQVYKIDAQTKGGTGLGLSICKSLTDLMGGKIWVQSKPGQGASFFFSIPLYPE